jgi:monofunctional biosynthetic peptidoglycan transglycosylase
MARRNRRSASARRGVGARWWRWGARAAVALVALVVVGLGALWITTPDVGRLAKVNPDTTAFIELRRQEAERAGKKLRVRWTWRKLSQISPLLRTAVVHAEDARFFTHAGVDWEAVKETAERNWRERSLSRGGSTITQQVAKNLYLSPARSPLRKLRELFIAWELEDELDKQRILEIYLNIAEWGPGVFGAEAAARAWYGKSAAALDAAEAARLAVALPNPRTRSPRVKSRALDRKAARLARALYRGGLIDAGELSAALAKLGQPATPFAAPPTAEEKQEPQLPGPDPDPGLE